MRAISKVIIVCALALGAGTLGCQEPANHNCPRTIGSFVPATRELEGNCSTTFAGNAVTIAATDVGTVTRIENRFSDTVKTEVIMRGCALNVQQHVIADDKVQSEVVGELDVNSDREFNGVMRRTVYRPDGAVECQGMYDMQYLRDDLVLGAAALRAKSGS